MRSRIAILAFATVLWASQNMALAHSLRVGNLEIIHPWIEAPLPGANKTCAYLKIVNYGPDSDRLLSITTPVARHVTLMQVRRSGQLAKIPQGIVISPKAALLLRRPRWCVQLTDFQVTFDAEYGIYDGTLVFEKAGSIAIEFMCEQAKHEN